MCRPKPTCRAGHCPAAGDGSSWFGHGERSVLRVAAQSASASTSGAAVGAGASLRSMRPSPCRPNPMASLSQVTTQQPGSWASRPSRCLLQPGRFVVRPSRGPAARLQGAGRGLAGPPAQAQPSRTPPSNTRANRWHSLRPSSRFQGRPASDPGLGPTAAVIDVNHSAALEPAGRCCGRWTAGLDRCWWPAAMDGANLSIHPWSYGHRDGRAPPVLGERRPRPLSVLPPPHHPSSPPSSSSSLPSSSTSPHGSPLPPILHLFSLSSASTFLEKY